LKLNDYERNSQSFIVLGLHAPALYFECFYHFNRELSDKEKLKDFIKELVFQNTIVEVSQHKLKKETVEYNYEVTNMLHYLL
jgi:hypothetical protein